MNPIPQSVVRRYMLEITSTALSSDSDLIDVHGGALANLRRRPDFDAVIDYLRAKEYIKTRHFDDEIWYLSLTDKGITYFEDRRDAIQRFLMNSIIVPILVAIITTVITVYILPSVGKRAEEWLHTTPRRTEQPEPAASQADAPSDIP